MNKKTTFTQKLILNIIMGGWQLEATKFCLYIFAPVAAFAYFHKYENFEEKIEDYHRSQTSASAIKNEIMITEFQQKLREKRDQKFKDELEHIRATEAGELKEKLANLENIANK